MVRSAPNDFDAMRTAQGMENAGATVISITYNGQHQPFGALEPSSKFVVWARVPDSINIDDVDAAIDKELG
jgi:hypothetical protein